MTNSEFPAGTDSRYVVSGTIRDQYQQLMHGVMVRAFDKDIRNEQSLGEAQTNEQGFYEIYYSRERFAYSDKKAADVFLRSYDVQGQLLKQTDVHYNAPAKLKINISLSGEKYKGISEYERVLATVTPFIGKLTLAALTETSGNTGYNVPYQ